MKKRKKKKSTEINPGKEYERFVFDRFKPHFPNFECELDVKVLGFLSNKKRQIDILIKGRIGEIDLLYVVECKDRSRVANIQSIDSFSAVMRDVRASKGYLMSGIGFAKQIYQYAQSVGIELVSIEDIKSPKWNVKIEIPTLYTVKRRGTVSTEIGFTCTQELVEKYGDELEVKIADIKEVSLDGGKTSIGLENYINGILKANDIDVSVIPELHLSDPALQLNLKGVWVPASFRLFFEHEKELYLKYVVPENYYQMTDHAIHEVVPLLCSIRIEDVVWDDTYIKVSETNIPVSAKLCVSVEEPIKVISSLMFTGMKNS